MNTRNDNVPPDAEVAAGGFARFVENSLRPTSHAMVDDPATGRYWVWARDVTGRRRRWGYRGAHRRGAWTVDALTEAVIAQRSADDVAYRHGLRRPIPSGPILLGTRYATFQFYGVVPDAPDAPAATLTLALPDVDATTLEALQTTADDAPTGPIFATDFRANGTMTEWTPRPAES